MKTIRIKTKLWARLRETIVRGGLRYGIEWSSDQVDCLTDDLYRLLEKGKGLKD
jgi:hypothetical protein